MGQSNKVIYTINWKPQTWIESLSPYQGVIVSPMQYETFYSIWRFLEESGGSPINQRSGSQSRLHHKQSSPVSELSLTASSRVLQGIKAQ